MATTLETRYTNYSRSGTGTPAISSAPAATFYSDARGFLKISYQLNDTKTKYTVTVEHYANYYNNSEMSCYINATSITSKVKIGDGSWSTLGTFSKTLTGTINSGTKYTASYGSKSFDVPINDDGSAIFSLQCIFNATNIDYIKDSGYYAKGGTQRTWIYNDYELPKVNVTSSITSTATSSAGKQFGQSVNFTITRPNTSVTHTLTYKVGSKTYTIGSGITTSKSYTFPTSLINNFPNNEKVSIVVTCTSSNGTSSTTTVYLTVPSEYVPTCSLVIEDVGNVPEEWGIWLKSISKIKGTITAEGIAESTIKSYKSTANGSTYTTPSFETAVLKNSGSQTITSTVTDSRTRTLSATEKINVIDYFIPSIGSYSVVRCLEDGSENNDGTYGKVKCTYSIAPINDGEKDLNTKSLIVKYGNITKTFELTDYSGSFEATDLFSDLSTAAKHSFEFYLIDYFNPNGVLYSFDMSPSFVTVSKLAGGKGITFGQIATEEGFHSYMDAYFHNALNAVDEDGNIVDIVNRFANLNLIKKTSVGLNSSDVFYIRGTTEEGQHRQLRIQDECIAYEKYDGSNWNVVWKDNKEAKILWGGDMTSGWYMNANQTATLSEKISEQKSGVVLVFCYYNGTSDTNYGWQSFFIPKNTVAAIGDSGHGFLLSRQNFRAIGTKYLYIRDNRIIGNSENENTGTNNGITYANNKFVLRYVIGV